MSDFRLGAVELRFARIVWANAPLSSGELVRLCEAELNWKKSTTYTVLRKLCQRGLFRNRDGVVSVEINEAGYFAIQSEQFVEETFGGSLPTFLAAFTTKKKLSREEITRLRQMIESCEEN